MKAFILSSLVAGVLAFPMVSQAASDHSHHAMTQTSAPASTLVDGVVKKVDKAAGKVTLSHGPLTNLNMPAMTMAFSVKDAGWLKTLKEGAKVRFMAERVNNAFTIVQLEAAGLAGH